jgi:hypothetical protein
MTRVRGSVAVLLLAGALASCHWGPRPWLSPRGVRITARDSYKLPHEGELLAVQDDGLLFLDGDVVRFVGFGPGFDVVLEEPGPKPVRGRPDPKTLGTLAYYARYPGGLDTERLAALLGALGQDSVVRLR